MLIEHENSDLVELLKFFVGKTFPRPFGSRLMKFSKGFTTGFKSTKAGMFRRSFAAKTLAAQALGSHATNPKLRYQNFLHD